MDVRQRHTVYGWIRENYAGSFLDDIINIIFIFYQIKLNSNILSADEQDSLLNLLLDALFNKKARCE